MQKFIIRIDEEKEELLDNLDEECYVLKDTLKEDFCRRFTERVAKEQKIVLFYGEQAVEKALYFGTDGVIVDLGAEGVKEKAQELRKKLGKGKYLGLISRSRRHEGMLISEAEPDFVVFKVWKDGFQNLKELTDWYSEFFLIQSAAWLMEDGIDFKLLKTDFIITPYA